MGAAQGSIGSEPIGPGGGRGQVCISTQHRFLSPVLSFAAVLGVVGACLTHLVWIANTGMKSAPQVRARFLGGTPLFRLGMVAALLKSVALVW